MPLRRSWYVEQHKADVDFNTELLDKLTAFKEYANEANNKLILETALQEQAERQELIRERVRFIRQIEFIEKAYQVENGNERNNEAMRMQRQQAQTQQSYQQQYAAIMASFQPKWEAAEKFLKSEQYQEIQKELEAYKQQHPNQSLVIENYQATLEAVGNPENNAKAMQDAIKGGANPKQVQQLNEARMGLFEELKANMLENANNPEKMQINGVIIMSKYLKEAKEGKYDPWMKDALGEFEQTIAKVYGVKEVTLEVLSHFQQDIKSGKLTIEDLNKANPRFEDINKIASLPAIQEERKALQDKMKYNKEAMTAVELARYNELVAKEMELKVSAENIRKDSGQSDLQEFRISLKGDNGEISSIYLKAKSEQAAMLEHSTNFLKIGIEDVIKDSTNTNSVQFVLDEFMKSKLEWSITHLSNGKGEQYSGLNREYAKLGALDALYHNSQDENLKTVLEVYIEKQRDILRVEYKNKYKNELTDAEIEKIVNNLTSSDFENTDPYKFAGRIIEAKKTETQEQQQVASLSTPTPKITQGEETFDEKVTRLMKEGLSLGQIKEAHPELDVLVPKEFEAEALGRNNTEDKDKVAENTLNNKGIEVGIFQ